MNLNPKKVLEILQTIAKGDKFIVAIIRYKSRSQNSPDGSNELYSPRFKKRLHSIRICNELVPPIDWKKPYPLISKNVHYRLVQFAMDLDEYNIKKRTEEIKRLEQIMIKDYDKSLKNQDRLRTRLQAAKFYASSDDVKPLLAPKDYSNFQHWMFRNPISWIEKYESKNGTMEELKTRNRSEGENLQKLLTSFVHHSKQNQIFF